MKRIIILDMVKEIAWTNIASISSSISECKVLYAEFAE
jgi:hypothetical protein